MNKASKAIEPIFLIVASFAITAPVLVKFIESNISPIAAEQISSYSLTATTILAAIMIALDNKTWRACVIYVCVIWGLLYYQTRINQWGTAGEFYADFVKHGIGGFLVGLSVLNYNKFLKLMGVFSLIYILIFFFEPVSDTLLHINDEMVLGYLLTSLTVPLIVAFFTIYNKNRYILFITAAISLEVTLLTSRGCGIILVMVWATMFYMDKKRNNMKMNKLIARSIIWIALIYLLLQVLIKLLLKSNISFEEGSFMEKLIHGYLISDNGRNDILDAGLLTLSQYWQTGVGMGADRILGEYNWVHNIVLELSLNFGVPLAICIIVSYFYVIYRGVKLSTNFVAKSLVVCLSIRIWVQLLLSSSYLVSMFWLTIPLGLAVGIIVRSEKRNKVITKA